MSPEEAAAIAAEYFSVVPYATLSTLSGDGPWVSPVYFSTTPDLDVLWPSALDAQHSRNIATDGRVALVFYDTSTPFGRAQGLYVTGMAGAVGEDELQQACEAFYRRRFPDPDERRQKGRRPPDFLDPSPRRMYRCRVERAWVLDPSGHPAHGALVDVRAEVPLAAFRSAYLPPRKPPESTA